MIKDTHCFQAWTHRLKGFVIWLLALALTSHITAQDSNQKYQRTFDHLVFLVDSSQLEEEFLKHLFTPAEKLKTIHHHQGTTGSYILLCNTFIEFLYLTDIDTAKTNEIDFGSEYSRRWRDSSEASRLGIGIKAVPFGLDLFSDDYTVYNNVDGIDEHAYVMSNANRDLDQPLVYVTGPENSFDPIDDFDDLSRIENEDIRRDVKKYMTHPSGIRKLTGITVTKPADHETGSNWKLLEELDMVTVVAGETFSVTLIFDQHAQGKVRELNGELNVSIRY